MHYFLTSHHPLSKYWHLVDLKIVPFALLCWFNCYRPIQTVQGFRFKPEIFYFSRPKAFEYYLTQKKKLGILIRCDGFKWTFSHCSVGLIAIGQFNLCRGLGSNLRYFTSLDLRHLSTI
jgi:hypothetical protein